MTNYWDHRDRSNDHFLLGDQAAHEDYYGTAREFYDRGDFTFARRYQDAAASTSLDARKRYAAEEK